VNDSLEEVVENLTQHNVVENDVKMKMGVKMKRTSSILERLMILFVGLTQDVLGR
jgi:hypothetical protein